MPDLFLRFNGPIPKYLTKNTTLDLFEKKRLFEFSSQQKTQRMHQKNALHQQSISSYPLRRPPSSQHKQ